MYLRQQSEKKRRFWPNVELRLFVAVGVVLLIAPRRGLADPVRVGEPYELAGKRLVFTSWIYVRPGDVGWYNSEGGAVNADESVKHGPFETVWKPTDHQPWGIRLRAQRPVIRKGQVKPKYPWESEEIVFKSIVRDGDVYKAWVYCGDGRYGYMESKDGLAWERPKLGLVEYEGSKENNLVGELPGGNVFIDPTSKEERYKCIWTGDVSPEQFEAYKKRRPDGWGPRCQRQIGGKLHVTCVWGAVSRDGFRWTRLPDPVVVEHSDTEDVCYYDARRKKYVAYLRTWNALPRSASLPGERWDYWLANGRRSIGRSETDDFRNFPLSEMILEPGPAMAPTDGLYTNCFTWVPGGPDQFLMFPAIRHLRDDTSSIWMASSAGGEIWHWLPGSPVMETAPFGQWDGGCIWVSPPLMEWGDGSFALRYSGHNFPHKYPRGLRKIEWGYAIWPHGRIVALEAAERGEFATVAIIPKGQKLYINTRTKRTGDIRVAAQVGQRGAGIIPGREFEKSIPIVGDQPRAPVRWKGADDLGIKPGEPVILLFKMEQAEIFGLEFE